MSVKEIIKLAGIYLQLEEVLELADLGGTVVDPSELTAKNLDLLVRCLNLVYDEIATDYIPLNYSEKITVTNEIIDFNILTKRIIDVIKLSDAKTGANVRYKLYPTTIKLPNGSYILEYSYMPNSTTIDGTVENFKGKLTERIIAYGVASEYCLISGLFDEAKLWEKRFKDALLIASRKKSDVIMPGRRWF